MPSLPAADRGPVATTVAFAAVAVLACAMPVQNDTWWHLRSGLETLHGRSPFADHFSWTVAGTFFWNHSWLAQVVFYVVHRTGGMPLLTALCAAMVTLAWLLVWRRCQGDLADRLLLLGWALSIGTSTWSVRPQVAIVLLPVLVGLVARTRVAAAGVVMLLWANLHGGFALGVLVLLAGIGAALAFDRGLVRRRILAAAVGIGATLLTPLGVVNWREISASLVRSRANAISEWLPPGFDGVAPIFWAMAVVFVVAAISRWRRLDSPYLQVSAMAAFLALLPAARAMRNVPGFVMLALPPLSAAIAARPTSRGHERWLADGLSGRALQAGALAVAALIIGSLWTHPTDLMGWRPLTPAAQRAIADCPAPMFNTYALGGPIIWFVPTQPVFVDSRQDPYPIELVQAAARVERDGAYEPLFTEKGIRCAVLPRNSRAVPGLLAHGWATKVEDRNVIVLVRQAGRQPSGR